MPYITENTLVEDTWVAVTNTPSMLQFKDKCLLYLGTAVAPTSTAVAFTMVRGEKYVSASSDVTVWCRSLSIYPVDIILAKEV